MQSAGELRRENETLRVRISRLSTAILRINVSPDLSTVLREAVDGVRVRSGARIGGVVALGGSGRVTTYESLLRQV